MFIKELEITGFKSFGEPTKISFNSPITGIVGPNGCGKSNILDAIKWVLGEKSVKSMRGEKMEDVIFSGTENIKPSGFAQVNILLDNSSKVLDFEFNEIKISRKLFRDGQSQFFFNDNRLSRKELENILMDTGLGKSSYSFMEQGQMDMILSSKPEDRRYIFEEAAGISRFKSQKEESEKKLEQTRFNITRLKDIINELERELKIKQSQSEKTRLFQELEEKRQIHDQKIMLVTVSELEENLVTLKQKLEKKVHEREKSRQKTLQWEEQVIMLDQEKQKYIQEMHQKDILHQLNNEKITQLDKSLEINQQRRQQVNEELETLRGHLSNIKTRIDSLKGELSGQKQLFLELNHQLGDTEKNITDITNTIEKLRKEIETNQADQKKTQQEVESKREFLKEQRKEREVIIQNLLEFLKKEKDSWSNVLLEIESQKNDFKTKLSEFSGFLNQTLEKMESSPENIKSTLLALNKKMNASEWLSTVEKLSDLEKTFWNQLFEKGGIHSQKEEFDEKISLTEKNIEELEATTARLLEEANHKKEEINKLSSKKEKLIGDIKTFEVKKNNLHEKEKAIAEQVANEEKSLHYFNERHSVSESELLQLNQREKAINREIQTIKNSMQSEISKIEAFKQNILKLDEKREKLFEQIKKENISSRDQFEESNDLEVKIGTLLGSIEVMRQDTYNNYNLTFEELKKKFKKDKIDLKVEKEQLNEIQKNIREIGTINPLAIEELNTIQSLYDHNQEQLEDIVNASKDIMNVIDEIQAKSEKIFMESFEKITENFKLTFRKLFKGGEVNLKLSDNERPLESGIEIQVQPPGKRARSLRLLSGGEKALTAISLMFGVYMLKSSPFCVLDEIDAPLDDQNVGRFLTLLDDFKNDTQFLLITHNKKTMAKTDTLFGVTMNEPGISRLLSVEVKAG